MGERIFGETFKSSNELPIKLIFALLVLYVSWTTQFLSPLPSKDTFFAVNYLKPIAIYKQTNECMHEWMNERVSERASERTNEQTNEQSSERTTERLNERASERTNERKNGGRDGRTDEWMKATLIGLTDNTELRTLPLYLQKFFSLVSRSLGKTFSWLLCNLTRRLSSMFVLAQSSLTTSSSSCSSNWAKKSSSTLMFHSRLCVQLKWRKCEMSQAIGHMKWKPSKICQNVVKS